MMKVKNWNAYYFFGLLGVVGVLTFFVLQPFVTAIFTAAVFAALFGGVYRRLLSWTGERRGLSAAATLLFILVVIIVPLLTIVSVTANEVGRLYQEMSAETTIAETLVSLRENLSAWPILGYFVVGGAFDSFLDPETVAENARGVSQFVLGILQAIYQNLAHFVFWIFAMFFTLYYFLTDGDKALRFIMRLSPLKNEHEQVLIREFVSVSRATIKGTLVIGLIQGFFGGVAFAIAGLPSPVIWGLVMALLSLIPLAGAGIVWFPAALILLFTGNVWQGVFMLIIGFGLISTIDNVLRPKLVGRDTQIHPLLVFFATLGGLALFGIIGFIIGPIIVALFTVLVRIYDLEFRQDLEVYNGA